MPHNRWHQRDRTPARIRQATDPEKGTPLSSAGAGEKWIAVHEAAHAIVAIKAGIGIRGIRFYGDGFSAEMGIEEPDWQESTDEEMLRGLVRVDVAANIAEMMRGYEPKGGYPSRFFDDKDPTVRCPCPTDVIAAWEHANRLATVRFEKEGKEAAVVEMRAARRAIIKQAEAEAGQILQENSESLDGLSRELRRGAMTGTAVRAIVEGMSMPHDFPSSIK
jgi:hypothetical protein